MPSQQPNNSEIHSHLLQKMSVFFGHFGCFFQPNTKRTFIDAGAHYKMCNPLQIYNSYMIRAKLNSKKGEHKMKKDGPLIWSNDLSQIMTTLQTRRLIREMNRKSPHFHRKPQSESESLSQQINQTNIWSTIRGGSLNEKVFGHQETLYLLAMDWWLFVTIVLKSSPASQFSF